MKRMTSENNNNKMIDNRILFQLKTDEIPKLNC